jgi:hypothetical protein
MPYMVSSPQESPSAGGIMTLYRADHLLFMTNKPAAVSLVKKEQKKSPKHNFAKIKPSPSHFHIHK